MATINPTTIATTGVAIALGAASGGGDSITNNKAPGNLFFRVKNAGVAAIDVTIASPTKCSQGSTHPLVVNVAAGAEKDIGPLPSSRFGSTVGVTYSGVVTVTVGAYRV